jgi:AcrR family transcriptional regulator
MNMKSDLSKKEKSSPIKPRKLDRRVVRTRNALREALFALILEKGYDAVTVEEITNRADLGRTTFYLHYHDKEELLMESIGMLVDSMVEQMLRLPLVDWSLVSSAEDGKPRPAITLPFRHIAENADLYRIILRGDGTHSVKRRVHAILVQNSSRLIDALGEKEMRNLNPIVPMDVFHNYLAGAFLGFVTWWLEEEMPYKPEEMAVMFQALFVRGALDVLSSGDMVARAVVE